MSRQVWHECLLMWQAPLFESLHSGLVTDVAHEYFPNSPAGPPGTPGPLPVSPALVVRPVPGIPRMPFQVWRRPRTINPASLTLAGPFASQTTAAISWELKPVYDVVLDAAPAGGSSLMFQALGQDGRVIPGQQVTVNAATKVGFRCPGIQSILITGKGTATNINLTTQDDFANLHDWQRIETVGFPFDHGEIAAPAYNDLPQGFERPRSAGLMQPSSAWMSHGHPGAAARDRNPDDPDALLADPRPREVSGDGPVRPVQLPRAGPRLPGEHRRHELDQAAGQLPRGEPAA